MGTYRALRAVGTTTTRGGSDLTGISPVHRVPRAPHVLAAAPTAGSGVLL